MPDVETNRELARRIDAKDVDWFRQRFDEGSLAWLEKRVGSQTYAEVSRRIDMGDLGWVGTILAGQHLEGFNAAGPLLDRPTPAPYVSPLPYEPPPVTDELPLAEPEEPEERRRRPLAWLLLPVLVVAAVLAFLLSQCGGDDGASDEPNVVETAEQAGDLSTWNRVVEAADMKGPLEDPGPFTVFAPSDVAFDKLGPDVIEIVTGDEELAARLVRFHVVDGSLRRTQFQTGELTTQEGSRVAVTVAESTVSVGGATLGTEAVASNGVVHTIDAVLVPPGLDLLSLVPGAITALADESGRLTLSGKVGTEEAAKALSDPLRVALPDRVIGGLAVDPTAPASGFTLNLIGRARADDATKIRAAVNALTGVRVNDRLEVVTAPKLEVEINALLQAEPIQFDTGSATIRPASRATLDKLADLLKATPTGKVMFEGHTDSAGNAAANLRLSQARADAVKAAMVARGIEAARLTAKGYGSQRPIADNATAAGRQQNRRVEALVTP